MQSRAEEAAAAGNVPVITVQALRGLQAACRTLGEAHLQGVGVDASVLQQWAEQGKFLLELAAAARAAPAAPANQQAQMPPPPSPASEALAATAPPAPLQPQPAARKVHLPAP